MGIAETKTMKALTLHQPWASLIACGVKTIETRSWSTPYRGPLAIHAGAASSKAEDHNPVWQYCVSEPGGALLKPELRPLAFGAVVATCTLTDVVPITERDRGPLVIGDRVVDVVGPGGSLWLCMSAENREIEDQRPYGDFTPGRYAWLLEDIGPLAEPVPARGRQGLWNWESAR